MLPFIDKSKEDPLLIRRSSLNNIRISESGLKNKQNFEVKSTGFSNLNNSEHFEQLAINEFSLLLQDFTLLQRMQILTEIIKDSNKRY